MPTVFTWPYIGGKDDSEEATFRGEQRGYAADEVLDDVLGKGTLVGMAGLR